MSLRELPKIRDSLSYLYVEHARVEQSEHSISLWDKDGTRTVPCAALAAILLGPGTSITHAAVSTLAEVGCSVLWVGEGSIRLYAHGLGETRSSRRLLTQAESHSVPAKRAAVVRRMYEMRFAEGLPTNVTIEQVRGKEGVRVRTAYARLAKEHGVPWHGRRYERGNWTAADLVNRALSSGAACLYGVCHAAIVSAGYSPALGFIHTGKMLSFVYDIADLYRIDVVVPAAFAAARHYVESPTRSGLEREVRIACREAFRAHDLMGRLVGDIDRLLTLDGAAIEASASWVDGVLEGVGDLWAGPGVGPAEGGINYGDPDPGEGSDDSEG